MKKEIFFSVESVDKEELLDFLKEVDEDETILYPLGERVDLQKYRDKIWSKATHFTARSQEELAGMISIYLNDGKTKIAYITSFYIKLQYRGKGIASNLLTQVISYVQSKHFACIDLEVFIENKSAISLYEKYGFHITEKRDISYIMRYEFNYE